MREHGGAFAFSGTAMAMSAPAARGRSAVKPLEAACAVGVTLLVASLGYSAHRTYTVRAQVAEGLAAAYGLAPYVVRAFERARDLPTDHELAAAGDLTARSVPFIESISVDNGRIDVLFGKSADPAIAGRTISVTPYETASLEVVWRCGDAADLVGLKPLGFAAGGERTTPLVTTIERRYLPRQCD